MEGVEGTGQCHRSKCISCFPFHKLPFNFKVNLRETWHLTVGVPGDDGVGLQSNSRSELVDSSDSEDVFVVLDQPGADT